MSADLPCATGREARQREGERLVQEALQAQQDARDKVKPPPITEPVHAHPEVV